MFKTSARRFGNLEFPRTAISNIGKNGEIHQEPEDDVVKVIRGNEGWHHDSTYMPVQALGAVLILIVPDEGGLTGWAICEPPLNHWIRDTGQSQFTVSLSFLLLQSGARRLPTF